MSLRLILPNISEKNSIFPDTASRTISTLTAAGIDDAGRSTAAEERAHSPRHISVNTLLWAGFISRKVRIDLYIRLHSKKLDRK